MQLIPAAIFASEALGRATFGDRRRAERTQALVAAMAASPGASLSEACGSWGQSHAGYRLLNNAHVAVLELIDSIGAATGDRIQSSAVREIWLLQDTTEVSPTSARGAQSLGPLANPESQGLFLHSTVAVTDAGLPLGIAHQEVWVRDAEDRPSRPARYRTPIEGKESAKWLRSTQTALTRLGPTHRGIVVADREADIFELYALCQAHAAGLIVRAAQNRRIAEPAGQLAAAAIDAPIQGRATVAVGRAQERAPRRASVTIRSTTVTLLPPDRRSYAAARRAWWAAHPDSQRLGPAAQTPLPVNVVEVTEAAPPDGVTPLHWRLLTTLPVATLADCQRVIDGYARRWLIERFHYVLKSGTRLEAHQLESAAGWQRLTVLSSLVAWQVLWLTEVGRIQPGVSAATVVPPAVWQAVGALVTGTVPTAPPELATLVAQIGRLGGHLGRRGDGPPGVTTIWRGLRRIRDVLGIWQLVTCDPNHAQCG